jgi:hypothetical protein
MASRICSVAFNEQAWDTLHQLMGNWPDKSRNAVINHIINTYEIEKSQLENHIQGFRNKTTYLQEQIIELKQLVQQLSRR